MNILSNFNLIQNEISTISPNKLINLIVVSKGRSQDQIKKLINIGHEHFGENRVIESIDKWHELLQLNHNLKLHFIGKLQTNKVTQVVKYYSFFHSLDNEKLALKIYNEEKIQNKSLKHFIQVNLAEENQKSGILKSNLKKFIYYCTKDLKLNIIGLMCIPPINEDSEHYFIQLKNLALDNNLKELSMGMSNDYIDAIKNGATYVRIGGKIFN
jgi:pyridoxal phosphate enzyme (YggS family)